MDIQSLSTTFDQAFTAQIQQALEGYFHDSQQGLPSSFELIKSTKRRKVLSWKTADFHFFIKSYRYQPWSFWLHAMWQNKAKKSLSLSKAMNGSQIPTPKPIAYAQMHADSGHYHTLYFNQAVEGKPIEAFLDQKARKAENRWLIYEKLGKLWAKMMQKGFLHKDPNLSNVIINPLNKLVLIDFDNIYQYPFIPKNVQYKALANFFAHAYVSKLNNNENHIHYRDNFVFLHAFYEAQDFAVSFKNLAQNVHALAIERLESWNIEHRLNPSIDFYLQKVAIN